MSAQLAPTAAGGRMPTGFHVWVLTGNLAVLSHAVLWFAIGWTAAVHGPATSALITTLVVLPRAVLPLLGGELGDRFGPRRVVICCCAALCLVMVGVLAWSDSDTERVRVLVVLALASGTISSFQLPASGALSRLFVDETLLTRAIAENSSAQQVARIVGPALGGLLLVVVALGDLLVIEAGVALLVIMVLALLRPQGETVRHPGPRNPFRGVAEGLRHVVRIPGMVALLVAVALVAAAILPLLPLGFPLAARERGWTPAQTGVVEAAWVVGTLTVTLLVAKFGSLRRVGVALVIGPVVAAAGIAVLALTQQVHWAVAGSVVMGWGTALFTCTIIPLFVARSPVEMLTRFQSVLLLVQTWPLLVTNGVFGALTHRGGVSIAFAAAGLLALAAAAVCLLSHTLRTARVAGRQ
ncbi:MAG: MFS transporter [Propionibacteriaceae bacterium]